MEGVDFYCYYDIYSLGALKSYLYRYSHTRLSDCHSYRYSHTRQADWHNYRYSHSPGVNTTDIARVQLH